ncbi:hypothetical protein ERO13_D03G029900v2 [Gossypium hirsutum]|uniref:Uncharacterized protein n=2 Tax=Gossypium TaxID=3633 RepID=A0ABM2ZSB9_GOSHI|nr:uncharacterized protein LOC121215297 [Gossypium hirsutum]KAB2036848.1 hypothetical protein ES319_D03G031100v1 [Gossypium barbadense]KAG4154009.1 hypothetical protein ERO13_D03G029900v2 [Gossypium hirsutum]
MSNKVTKESKLSRYLKAPIRFLIKARDVYIKSMSEYSERIGFGTTMGCPTGQVNALPRSYSVGSTKSINADEDLRELIRAASIRSSRDKARLDLHRRQPARTGANRMPRSHSVVIGRINEDKPCEFGDGDEQGVLPRTRSYAVTKKKTVFF